MPAVNELLDMMDSVVETLRMELNIKPGPPERETLLAPEEETEPQPMTGGPTAFEAECAFAQTDALKLIQEIRRWGSKWTRMGRPNEEEDARLNGYLTRANKDFGTLMKCYPGFRDQIDQFHRDLGNSLSTLIRGGGGPLIARNVNKFYKDFEDYFRDVFEGPTA